MNIQTLRTEVQQLTPLSDADIQKLVDDGTDPVSVLESESAKATKLRALTFRLATEEKRLMESRQDDARSELSNAQAQQAKAQEAAQAAINSAVDAIAKLAGHFAAFEVARIEYAASVGAAKLVARTGGIQFDPAYTDIFPMIRPLDNLIDETLQPFRRAKPFNCQAIEPQESK